MSSILRFFGYSLTCLRFAGLPPAGSGVSLFMCFFFCPVPVLLPITSVRSVAGVSTADIQQLRVGCRLIGSAVPPASSVSCYFNADSYSPLKTVKMGLAIIYPDRAFARNLPYQNCQKVYFLRKTAVSVPSPEGSGTVLPGTQGYNTPL